MSDVYFEDGMPKVTVQIRLETANRIKMLASDLGRSTADIVDQAVNILVHARQITKGHEAERNS